MSKLLTQEELEEIKEFVKISEDYVQIKLLHHIDALTEQRDDDVKYLMAIFQECKRRAEKAEDELKRRDAVAGEPIMELDHTGAFYDYRLLTENLPNGKYKLYAAAMSPAVPDYAAAWMIVGDSGDHRFPQVFEQLGMAEHKLKSCQENGVNASIKPLFLSPPAASIMPRLVTYKDCPSEYADDNDREWWAEGYNAGYADKQLPAAWPDGQFYPIRRE
jgi:hypothetical protein